MTTLKITNARLDIEAQQGKTWRIHVAITDSNAQPITVTDCKWQARTASSTATTVLAADTSSGVTIGTGTIDIVVTAAVTAAISPGKYVHEVEIHTSSTEVPPFMSGTLTVLPEVVR